MFFHSSPACKCFPEIKGFDRVMHVCSRVLPTILLLFFLLFLSTLGEDAFLPLPSFCWFSAVFGFPWLWTVYSSLCCCGHMAFSQGLSLFFLRHQSYWLRTHFNPGWPHFNMFAKTLFPKKAMFTVNGSGGRTSP